MKYLLRLVVFFALTHSLSVAAQFDSISVKKLMWGDKFDAFKLTKAPDKWKDESAVILARKYDYSIRKEIFLMIIDEEQYYHDRILLLNNAAVNKYSEFDFEGNFGNTGFFRTTPVNTEYLVGIKVIKANGKVIEIPIGQAVEKEVKKGNQKKTTKSIAIPNLEVGDILDYYIALKKSIIGNSFYDFDERYLPLVDDYPIAKQEYNFQVLRKCYLTIKPVNGAPKAQIKEGEDGDFTYKISDENREKVDFGDAPWIYPKRELPLIKFQTFYASNSARKEYKFYSLFFNEEEPKISSTLSSTALLKFLNYTTDWYSQFARWSHNVIGYIFLNFDKYDNSFANQTHSYLKKRFKKVNDPELIAKEAFYYLRQKAFRDGYEKDVLYDKGYNYGASNYLFVRNLSRVLALYKIPHDILVTYPREDCNFDDMLLTAERNMVIRVNTPTPFILSNCNRYSLYTDINPSYQGNDAFVYALTKKVKDRKVVKVSKAIPVVGAEANYSTISTSVMFAGTNLGELNIKQKVEVKGSQKYYFQSNFITPYEYIENCKDADYKTPLLMDGSLSKKEKSELAARILEKKSQDEADRKERVDAYIKDEYLLVDDFKATSIKVESIGMWDQDPTFKYTTEFNDKTLVKKMGNNYLLEVGRLIGSQRDLSEKELVRGVDAYFDYARGFENNIEIAIPTGYTAKGVDKLVFNVSNSLCSFVATASVVGNKIVIKTTKRYNVNFVEKQSWDKVKSMLKAGVDFNNQKILFEKIK